MRIVLFLLCVLAFLAGGGILAAAQSAIHEIEAFILFLISAVLLVGASVVEAINAARKKIEASIQIPADVRKAAPPPQPVPVPPQPVAPAPPASRPYFFSADGKDSGPHSLDEMRRFHKSGELTDETLVIRQGDADWQPATMFPEICFER
jgi:GYF domain 2